MCDQKNDLIKVLATYIGGGLIASSSHMFAHKPHCALQPW